MLNDKTAGYREPADLPIDVALIDRQDGEWLYGDDPEEDPLRAFHGRPSTRRDGLSDDSDKKSKKKAIRKTAKDEETIQLLQSVSRDLTKTDPRVRKAHGDAPFKEFLARTLAAQMLNVPYADMLDAMYGGHEPYNSFQVYALGDEYKGLAEFMDRPVSAAGNLDPSRWGKALGNPRDTMINMPAQSKDPAVNPAMDANQLPDAWKPTDLMNKPAGDPVDQALKSWSTAQAKFKELKPLFEEAQSQEQELRKQVGGLMQDLEDKTREIDGMVFEYKRHADRPNPKYAQAWAEMLKLVDASLHPKLDQILQQFTSHSRNEVIKTSPAKKGGSFWSRPQRLVSVAASELAGKASFLLRSVNRTLDQILNTLRSAGMGQQELRRAAMRAREDVDWTDGLVRCAEMYDAMGQGGATGFKDGDQVTDSAGNAGTSRVMPDGSLEVTYSAGGKATFDAGAVEKGVVKRSTRRRL